MESPLKAIAPESLEVGQVYLQSELDAPATAHELGLPLHVVQQHLRKPEIKNYIADTLAEVGYSKRGKLGKVLDDVLDKKLAEMEELEMTSGKDVIEIIKLRHDMRMSELKLEQETAKIAAGVGGTNIQVNNNYSNLLSKLLKQ